LRTFADLRVISNGADADPLGVRRLRHGQEMAALLIILPVTVGLALRAGIHSLSWSLADSERAERTALVDACARTFIIVLLSLIGLLALGMMYGNVLGSVNEVP
jgi:ABC-type Fe3+ transport system permease subunit